MSKPENPGQPARPKRISAPQMPDFLPSGAQQQVRHLQNSDVQLQVYAHRSTEQNLIVPAVAEPLLVLVLSGEARVQERAEGEDWATYAVSTDDFFLTMTPEPYEMRWETTRGGDFKVLHLYLSQRILDLAAGDLFPGKVRLLDISAARDESISQMVRLLHQEAIHHQEPSTLYLQSIAQALAVHLVRHYRDATVGLRTVNALPAYKLNRVIEHMGHGLEKSFNLASLAALTGMSDFYFSRMFRKATGLTPSLYFIQMRMDRARELLLHSPMSIIEVALEVGYSSPSHFAQVFRRQTGVTPREYRRR